LNEEAMKLVSLAAVLNYSLLHPFTTANSWPVDELYVFGQYATEVSSIALSVRGDATAMSVLKPGSLQCKSCRAAHRCPALQHALGI
jgi:hypothetical protein